MTRRKVFTCKCPTCGALYEGSFSSVWELSEALPISGHNRVLYRVLAASFGKWVQTELLLSTMYGGPEAGPLYARNVLRQGIHYLRRLLPPYGITIETSALNQQGSRYHTTAYRLVWTAPPST